MQWTLARGVLVASKANDMSASALERQSGVGSQALTSLESPQFSISKRKADELSSSDGPSEPDSRHPVPRYLFSDGPVARGSVNETAAKNSRQFVLTEGGLAYAAVVAETLAATDKWAAQAPRQEFRPL